MNQALANTQTKGGLRHWLAQPKIVQGIDAALGGWMQASSFISQLTISCEDSDFQHCNPESKFKAIHECASLALLPSLGHVALIPRNVREDGVIVRTDLTVMPQWQGLQALMLRVEGVVDVQARLVHVNDDYSIDGAAHSITHTYDPFDENRVFAGFDDLRGGYLVVTWSNRPPQYHFVARSVFEKARKCAESDNIWKAWFYEQCLKTVYRNAYARRVVPIDPLVNRRLETAFRHEDVALGNNPERIIVSEETTIVDVPVPAEPPATRTEKLAGQMRQSSTPPPPPEAADEPEEDDAPGASPEAIEAAFKTLQEACFNVQSEEDVADVHRQVLESILPKDRQNNLLDMLKSASTSFQAQAAEGSQKTLV